MKHKILVDTIPLLSPLTGIGRYTYEISKLLMLQEDVEVSFFYGYYSKNLLSPSSQPDIKATKAFISKYPRLKSLARKVLALYTKLYSPSFDIYWQPNFIPLKGIKAREVVTSVHDFSFIHYRDFHPKERIEYFENNFYNNIKISDFIITGSYYTKQEIINILDIPDDKIKVIYHGINHEIFKIYDDLSLPFELPEKYILCVGSLEPRKNLKRLLEAYNNLSCKDEYKLVLVGFKGWENQEIMEIIDKNQEYIHYLGYLSDVELAKVYNKASIFVYPSLYEGFGLPPIEAMACGSVVITSDCSSIPEVCGDCAVYFDPLDTNDIKEKIEATLQDKILMQTLAQNGLKKAQSYTWEKSAQEHKKIFDMLCNTKN